MDQKKYQNFVFDFKNQKLIGDFEKMYQNEAIESYDSWSQDADSVAKELDMALLKSIDFEDFIDIGCGKGKFTKLIHDSFGVASTGYDISQTAIDIARGRYPEIGFYVNSFQENLPELKSDLVVFRAVLYYMENWKDVIDSASNARYIFVGLNIPEKTLGTIKSYEEFDEFIMRKWTPLVGYKGLDGTSRATIYKKR